MKIHFIHSVIRDEKKSRHLVYFDKMFAISFVVCCTVYTFHHLQLSLVEFKSVISGCINAKRKKLRIFSNAHVFFIIDTKKKTKLLSLSERKTRFDVVPF